VWAIIWVLLVVDTGVCTSCFPSNNICILIKKCVPLIWLNLILKRTYKQWTFYVHDFDGPILNPFFDISGSFLGVFQNQNKSRSFSEKQRLLSGCWWPVCYERKVLLTGSWQARRTGHLYIHTVQYDNFLQLFIQSIISTLVICTTRFYVSTKPDRLTPITSTKPVPITPNLTRFMLPNKNRALFGIEGSPPFLLLEQKYRVFNNQYRKRCEGKKTQRKTHTTFPGPESDQKKRPHKISTRNPSKEGEESSNTELLHFDDDWQLS
jgi:hypothetical protein